jgi:hypothetical protein
MLDFIFAFPNAGLGIYLASLSSPSAMLIPRFPNMTACSCQSRSVNKAKSTLLSTTLMVALCFSCSTLPPREGVGQTSCPEMSGMVTGADLSPDQKTLAVLTYNYLFLFRRIEGHSRSRLQPDRISGLE